MAATRSVAAALIQMHRSIVAAGALPARSFLVRVAPIITACLAALIIGITFQAGVKRGMDHVTTYGPESEQTAISVALSDNVYKLRRGYVAYATVHNKLLEVWNRGVTSPSDPLLIKNTSDRELMNEAITAAASLGPQSGGFISDRTLITTIYDDQGYVDYVKLAFRLFGLRIESMYYTFFALIGLSSLI